MLAPDPQSGMTHTHTHTYHCSSSTRVPMLLMVSVQVERARAELHGMEAEHRRLKVRVCLCTDAMFAQPFSGRCSWLHLLGRPKGQRECRRNAKRHGRANEQTSGKVISKAKDRFCS